MGIDLSVNPDVIAVDPSQIPLGSQVYVHELNKVFTAGDTGGDISYNRIDVHFQTVNECLQFGRQTLTITVL